MPSPFAWGLDDPVRYRWGLLLRRFGGFISSVDTEGVAQAQGTRPAGTTRDGGARYRAPRNTRTAGWRGCGRSGWGAQRFRRIPELFKYAILACPALLRGTCRPGVLAGRACSEDVARAQGTRPAVIGRNGWARCRSLSSARIAGRRGCGRGGWGARHSRRIPELFKYRPPDILPPRRR